MELEAELLIVGYIIGLQDCVHVVSHLCHILGCTVQPLLRPFLQEEHSLKEILSTTNEGGVLVTEDKAVGCARHSAWCLN